MSDQEDTLRGRRYYHEKENEQVKQQGGEELARKPQGEDARDDREEQEENRERLGVNEKHKTRKMEKEKRGTYP